MNSFMLQVLKLSRNLHIYVPNNWVSPTVNFGLVQAWYLHTSNQPLHMNLYIKGSIRSQMQYRGYMNHVSAM